MPKVNIGTRVDQSVVDRLDAIARALAQQTPGLEVKRSDAARMAIEMSLEALERRSGVAPASTKPAPKGGKPTSKARK